MCLTNQTDELKKFKSKHKNHTTVTVYKYLEVEYINTIPRLVAPFRGGFEYKAGINLPTTNFKGKVIDKQNITSGGLHVYLNKKSANDEGYDDSYLVKFTAKLKDLIAVNRYDDGFGIIVYTGVFKKLHLAPSEYKRAISTL